MGCIRPATPGFLVTLAATVLLAVVSFCVPFFKSVYFLRAAIEVEDISGAITFGTLGYCIELPNGTTCSKPSIGYQLDINELVGNNLPIEIPEVAVKWITYCLFAHVVALGLSVVSSLFGLLAHVREMSMVCFSTCISGFAAAVALLAFIFDLVLFFVAKARINAVGTASMGNGIWLTLAAWILLFFSGCFFSMGRCCLSRREGGSSGRNGWRNKADDRPNADHSEQLRLDAVKAEADRKARERLAKEQGLPAYPEMQPLTARIDGDRVVLDTDDYKDASSTGPPSPSLSRPSKSSITSHARPNYAAGGYAPAAPGNSAMDDYYNTPAATPATYPPPQRQASTHSYAASTGYGSPPQRQPSGYTPTSSGPYGQTGYGAHQTSPPPMPTTNLAVPGQTPHDPYNPSGYGHAAGGSSYHTATSHDQQPSAYNDPYGPAITPAQNPASQYNDDPYARTSAIANQTQQSYYSPKPQPYTGGQSDFLTNSTPDSYARQQSPTADDPYASIPGGYGAPAVNSTSPYQQPTPQRQYTIGGDGYGNNTVPPLAANDPYSNNAYAYTLPASDSFATTTPMNNPYTNSPPKDSYASNPYTNAPSNVGYTSNAYASSPVNDGYTSNPYTSTPVNDGYATTPAASNPYTNPATASTVNPYTNAPTARQNSAGYGLSGPRPQPATIPEDAPPQYDTGPGAVSGNWGKR